MLTGDCLLDLCGQALLQDLGNLGVASGMRYLAGVLV